VPFKIHRFLASRFLAQANTMEARAAGFVAIVLWMESFRQDPAGSLPADDVQLARLAGFGPDVAGWLQVREGALYGWHAVEIEGAEAGDDPRLGHRMIETIARDLIKRKKGRDQSRSAGDHAVKRSRIKKMMISIGNTRLADNPQVLAAVCDWIITHDLYITEENVRSALEAAAGVPRVVRGPNGGGMAG
jgi:hypothetical protein